MVPLAANVRVTSLCFQLWQVLVCLSIVTGVYAVLHSPSRPGCHICCGGHSQLLLGVEGTTGKSHLHSSSRDTKAG